MAPNLPAVYLLPVPIPSETPPETPQQSGIAQTLLQGLGGVLWEADGNTFAFSFVSPEAEALLGYPADQWVAEPDFWRAHLHVDDADWCVAFCRGAVAAGRDHTFEYRMIAVDGRAVWVRDVVSVRTNDDGTITLRGILLDVSRWYRVEEQRSHLERRTRIMFESASIGMALIDLDARFLETNTAIQTMLGYTGDELRGMTIPQVTHPEDVTRDAELYERTLAGGLDYYSIEKRFIRKDGQMFWGKVTASLVRDSAGRAEYGVGMLEDVTARKELEAQQLQAQKLEAVGRLAGGIAHDFNNLLTVIRGYSDFLMLGRSEDDEVRHDAGEIRQAADRAAMLIQQLLAFSRKQQLYPVVLDVNDVVRLVGAMLERLIGEHVALLTRLGRDVGSVFVDRGQLQQVLVNLALNARDAMPKGGTLVIETRSVKLEAPDGGVPAGNYLALAVSDTGHGIPANVLPRIFEPFFTTKDVGHGTGLGLSTAYGIVQQSGGHLTVSSTPGEGTTFTVLLPRVGATAPGSDEATVEPRRGTGETILLVEDEEMVRRLTKHTLERRGYRVLATADGAEALARARQKGVEFDMVITDVAMPGMSGPELVRQLGALRAGAPILYISGYADGDSLRRDALGDGEFFLAKPFSASDLDARVREILDGR